MNALMKNLRRSPPLQMDGKPVVVFEDYLLGKGNLPPSDALRFWLADDTKIVIRPSGTEPKVKIYTEIVEKKTNDIQSADLRLKQMTEAFLKEFIYTAATPKA